MIRPVKDPATHSGRRGLSVLGSEEAVQAMKGQGGSRNSLRSRHHSYSVLPMAVTGDAHPIKKRVSLSFTDNSWMIPIGTAINFP
ncbi:hypothetical protein MKK67_15200 [Methylobacterium sp. J-072]|uniref:hypothetical protein n=1 Tax=Methylobacterium sp. J-072 TaxID=2836651 RepID=UPI001FBB1525|nr:hypothetical protein [Methylobacterium sp. J-072]MCJ2093828.1 hypothetical protein [Methylobacterium sp. J-072]